MTAPDIGPAALDEVCRLNEESKKHSIIAIVTATNGNLLVTAGLVTWLTGGTKETRHCNAKISSGELDWVLSRIEQDEVYDRFA